MSCPLFMPLTPSPLCRAHPEPFGWCGHPLFTFSADSAHPASGPSGLPQPLPSLLTPSLGFQPMAMVPPITHKLMIHQQVLLPLSVSPGPVTTRKAQHQNAWPLHQIFEDFQDGDSGANQNTVLGQHTGWMRFPPPCWEEPPMSVRHHSLHLGA